MSKDTPETKYGPAQPLLRGVNLARFLCDACPFYRLPTEARRFAESAEKEGMVRPAPSSLCGDGPRPSGDAEIPGRL